MYHVRAVPEAEWDAWAEVPVDPEDPGAGTREPTKRELLQRNVRVLARPGDGSVYVSVGIVEWWLTDVWGELPGEVISEGYLLQRYGRRKGAQADRYTPGRALGLPEEAVPHVLRARVFRSTDGTSLRAALESEVASEAIEPRVPVTGTRSAARPHPDEEAILEEARARAFPEDETTPTARRLMVPISAVDSGDVVEADELVPHRWAGEPDR